jgi:tRNA (mo5U34)-methyltransferase
VNQRLREEIETGPPWMYRWELAAGLVTPLAGPELADIHETRLELLEEPVRAALAIAPGGGTAIDLACNEGWFSHRLLDWGARKVLGVDVRPSVIRRAELLRDHFGISPERLELRCSNIFELDACTLGAFDVVLCLGLVYHLENPVGALRIARSLTRGVCIIESQLTRQMKPITFGFGQSGVYEQSVASFAVLVESDQDGNPRASAGGVMSLIPNRAALLHAATAAGFSKLDIVEPQSRHNRQYRLGDRVVLIARV